MGYQLSRTTADDIFKQLKKDYRIFAPMVFPGEGCYSDTDVIRYGEAETLQDIEFERKSDYSFKEALFPINETLFYFTEEETSVPALPDKGILIFLRSCDIHALKRLDSIYLNNGPEDFYYKRLREKAKFVLIGCSSTCANGFCASLGTNLTEDYDLYLKISDSTVLAECKCEELAKYSLPQKICFNKNEKTGGTLQLIVLSGAFAMEIKQREPQILSQINTYFGYNVVTKLKIIQNSCPENFLLNKKPIDNVKKILVSAEEQNYITEIIKDVDNSNLREHLENLGKAVFSNKQN